MNQPPKIYVADVISVLLVLGFIGLISAMMSGFMASEGFTFSSLNGNCPEDKTHHEGRCIDPEVDQEILRYFNESGDTLLGKASAQLGVPEWRIFVAEDRSDQLSCYVKEPGGFGPSLYGCSFAHVEGGSQ